MNSTDIKQLSAYRRRRSLAGFTLVEMLVSVALVVIMMAMFASVFQLAAGSMSTQRGIAENDQRARSLATVIRSDLKARSFKNVISFGAAEAPPPLGTIPFIDREGYFYISENDPNDDTDDVLQFTVKLLGTTGDFYFGRAASLFALSTGATQADETQFEESNEPDRDDFNPGVDTNGDGVTDSTDQSSRSIAAEITYFLRSGRLYRRVILLRHTDGPSQPSDKHGTNYFDPNNNGDDSVIPPIPMPYTGNFWSDFDFSARHTATGVLFNSVSALDNTGTGISAVGNPKNRFGFSHEDGNDDDDNGLPREYVGAANDVFIGRFTHQETSDARFQYPHLGSVDSGGSTLGNGNPMDWFAYSGEAAPATTPLSLNTNGVVAEFNGGSRRSEDLLLSNVHAFDVKVWDDVIQQFVDIGHNLSNAGVEGDFHQNRNQNTTFGPRSDVNNRVFDTWHPNSEVRGNVDPPFRPQDGSGDPKPLRAIQITIRFLDISSNQMRQLTLQVSLMGD